jgi:hypothetical protein
MGYQYKVRYTIGEEKKTFMGENRNIYEVIKRIRKDEPEAHTFVVLQKEQI